MRKTLLLFLEAVVKLLCPIKSMILTPVLRASKLARAAQTRPCPNGQARLRGENRRQKGDFMGRMSFAIASLIFLAGCFAPASKSSKPVVLVTIPPYAYFVEQIAGDNVSTEIFVPPGANPHTYEPTPKQVEKFAQAKIWFRFGDPIEQKILPFLREKHVKDIDLSKGLPLLTATEHVCGDHVHEGKDLHVWLDPHLASKQAKRLSEELSLLWPEHKKLFEQNYAQLAQRLETLDQEIQTELRPYEGITLMLSHPALGYYCKRYGLHQISVECEGKDPLPKQVAYVVQEAQDENVKVIFIEPQYNNKGAHLIAEKLELPIYQIDPYALDYFHMMRDISKSIVIYYGHQK